MHKSRATLLGRGLWMIAWALLLGGCGNLAANYEPGTKSLLEFSKGPNYQMASLRARNPYDSNDRYRGTLTLANAPFASEAPFLTLFEQNIKDRDPSVQMAATRGLANHGSPEDALLLTEALENEAVIVRLEAARGLQRLHNPVAISALIRHSREAEETDEAVRSECAHALGQYAEPRVLSQLVEVVRDDPSLTVVSCAIEALKFLTGKQFGLGAPQWTNWARAESDLFAGQTAYRYRYFHRGRYLLEWIPFVGTPPNEISASPVGFAMGG